MSNPKHTRRKYWLDEPRNRSRVFQALVVVCALLFAADLFYTKHAETEVGGWLGFDGIFGFTACVGLVLAAKQLRRLVKRDEDTYD